ncbi:D-alanine aminotransferase [hydrothermal vent metagenome]|uniref:D-alanine aminotransferase n=1 Tax=hydrothermal vent metagenome TaxID=652676 RepID=A0A3B1BS73_9ZZZZ
MSLSSICYLNGDYQPLEQAKVSVLDRGFIFGDGVYEVIPAYGGHLFRLQQHLQRLDNSLKAIKLTNPLSNPQWQNMLQMLVEKNQDQNNGDQSIYLQLTRGVAKRDHSFPQNTPATVFAMSNPLPTADMEKMQAGVAAITLDDIRWRYCHIKTIALLPNILLKQEAIEKHASEAILVREGLVTEGSSSNLFIVNRGVIKTPVKSEQLLPGVTRDLIVELAQKNGLACEQTTISETELLAADEVWLSSSTREILPVTRLNEKMVGEGTAGPLWRKMIKIYQTYKQQLRAGAEIEPT